VTKDFRPVYHLTSPVLQRGLLRHLKSRSKRAVIVIGKQAGEDGLRQLLSAALAQRPRHHDVLIILPPLPPPAVLPARAVFDAVATGGEFGFLDEEDLLWVLRAFIGRDLAVGVSYSAVTGLVTFLTGDTSWLVIPAEAIGPNPKTIAIIDKGKLVTCEGKQPATFDQVRSAHDPVYRADRRQTVRDHDRSFGSMLRKVRRDKGLDQDEFKGLTSKTIQRIELGEVSEDAIRRGTREVIEQTLRMTFAKIKAFEG
jgi:hypothetical protein